MNKIAIVVEGGMVQTVYSLSDDINVEVIDLDISDFASEEEEKEQIENIKRVEQIQNDSSYKVVW